SPDRAHGVAIARVTPIAHTTPVASTTAATANAAPYPLPSSGATTSGPSNWPAPYTAVNEAAADAPRNRPPTSIASSVIPMNVAPNNAAATTTCQVPAETASNTADSICANNATGSTAAADQRRASAPH